MPHSAIREAVPSLRDGHAAAVPDPVRAVGAAIVALRRGDAVTLRAEPPLLLIAAETASATSLALLGERGAGPARLLLTALRGHAVLPARTSDAGPLALWVPPSADAPQALRGLADPTSEQVRAAWAEARTPSIEPKLYRQMLSSVPQARLHFGFQGSYPRTLNPRFPA